jgi:rhodanese-related sulfurtransferase
VQHPGESGSWRNGLVHIEGTEENEWCEMKKRLVIISCCVVGLLLSSCGASSNSVETQATDAPQTTIKTESAILIDVRSPEEFAVGHLQGAMNYNVEDGTLEAALSSLDTSKSYNVYCQSGRRSAIAIALLNQNGFTRVTDLGGIDEAAQSTGISVVTN